MYANGRPPSTTVANPLFLINCACHEFVTIIGVLRGVK
jgi:hypothetical protein